MLKNIFLHVCNKKMCTIPCTHVSGTENLEAYLVPYQASLKSRFAKILNDTQREKIREKNPIQEL